MQHEKWFYIAMIVGVICLTIYETSKVYVEGLKTLQQQSQQVVER